MRVNGHNVLAILAAAVAMYAVGFVIYGLLVSDLWMQLSGVTQADFAGQEWRMALSPVMPILMAIGLSLTIKWRAALGWTGGASTGFWMALFFVFASRLYSFAYGTEHPGLLGIDAAHLFIGCVLGGAIIGGWKRAA